MELVTFSSENIDVVVLPEVGARIHQIRFGGADVLRTPADPREHQRDPFYWGGYVMAPWCNRLAVGPVAVGGQMVDLASNFDDGSAIHGQVYASAWQRTADNEFRIESGGDGWPWPYAVSLRVEVGAKSVRLNQSLTNLSQYPMPGGIGLHPWFVGRLAISINSDVVYPSNSNSAARPVPVSGDLDLRQETEMAVGVDASWPNVRDPAVDLRWPDAGIHAVLRAEGSGRVIVAANPGDRGAIAVEPETHAPQGLRRLLNGEPDGLTMVAPGAVLTLTSVLEFD
jgi:aldose 1-epimerase